MIKSYLNSIKLKNGVEVPMLGFGTSTTTRESVLNDSETCKESIKYALEIGYRHIDTATFYQNEDIVGAAIKESHIDRKEIFITTKLHPNDMGRDSARCAFKKSLQKLGVDYIDLYLIHAPWAPWKPADHELAKRLRLESWLTLIDLYNEGLCKAIGVSNYMPRHIQEIIDANLMSPLINQCEFHPYYTNDENLSFCVKNGINFEGYCPLARGAVLNDETVLALAKKYFKTPAQIVIRWSLQVFDFVLEEAEVKMLSQLNKNLKCSVDPTNFV